MKNTNFKKNIRNFKVIAASFTALFISFGFQNCSKVSFSQIPENKVIGDNGTSGLPNGPIQTCREVLQTTTKNVRILFMVDNSGSALTTDPNMYYRDQTIRTFLDSYGGKTNFTYSFGYFANSDAKLSDMTSKSYLTLKKAANPNVPYNVFSDATSMSSTLTNYEKIVSSGNTPYDKAFAGLNLMIDNDPVDPNYPVSYAVVFISDGMPNPALSDIELQSLMDQIKMKAANRGQEISLNTVYFGPAASTSTAAADAILRLKAMASYGVGQFIDTNNNVGGSLAIDNVVTVPGMVCTTTN